MCSGDDGWHHKLEIQVMKHSTDSNSGKRFGLLTSHPNIGRSSELFYIIWREN